MPTARFVETGGRISIRLKSGYMQPAVFGLFLWGDGDTRPMELGGGVLRDGNSSTVTPDMLPSEYGNRTLQAIVTISLLNGNRYAPEIHLEQDGMEIGGDSVDRSVNRHSIGVQFLVDLERA